MTMRYTFRPMSDATHAASAPPGRNPVAMVAGEAYDVDAEWAAVINACTPGIDGQPALVPVAGVEAAADFIAAISQPTPLNPETDAAVPTPGPVKRTRGKRGG